MTQTFAIRQAFESVSQVRETFGLIASSDEQFFAEWYQNLLQQQKYALSDGLT